MNLRKEVLIIRTHDEIAEAVKTTVAQKRIEKRKRAKRLKILCSAVCCLAAFAAVFGVVKNANRNVLETTADYSTDLFSTNVYDFASMSFKAKKKAAREDKIGWLEYENNLYVFEQRTEMVDLQRYEDTKHIGSTLEFSGYYKKRGISAEVYAVTKNEQSFLVIAFADGTADVLSLIHI